MTHEEKIIEATARVNDMDLADFLLFVQSRILTIMPILTDAQLDSLLEHLPEVD